MPIAAAMPSATRSIAAIVAFPDCAEACALRHETDHRVANHLAMLSSYLRLKSAEFDQLDAVSPEAVRLFAQSIDAQIRGVARLHRILTSQERDSQVELASLLREVCAPFASGLNDRVALIQDFSADCCVDADQVLPVSQIVSEAITNAVKHAHPADAVGAILIRSQAPASGGILIEVSDNGLGLPETFDPDCDGGFGFHLMRGLSKGLRAPLNFLTGADGLTVSLRLPVRPT